MSERSKYLYFANLTKLPPMTCAFIPNFKGYIVCACNAVIFFFSPLQECVLVCGFPLDNGAFWRNLFLFLSFSLQHRTIQHCKALKWPFYAATATTCGPESPSGLGRSSCIYEAKSALTLKPRNLCSASNSSSFYSFRSYLSRLLVLFLHCDLWPGLSFPVFVLNRPS